MLVYDVVLRCCPLRCCPSNHHTKDYKDQEYKTYSINVGIIGDRAGQLGKSGEYWMGRRVSSLI
jgi:hypothetical protein